MSNQQGTYGGRSTQRPGGRGRSERGGRGRGSNENSRRSVGRNIYRSEEQSVIQIWASLNEESRMRLIEQLVGMSPFRLIVRPDAGSPTPLAEETPALDGTRPSSRNNGPQVGSGNNSTSGGNERVWDRAIICEIPLFQRFKTLTASERRTAVNANGEPVNRLLSITTGVISRGQNLAKKSSSSEPTDVQILAAINENIGDAITLKALYLKLDDSDNNSSESSSSSTSTDEDQNSDDAGDGLNASKGNHDNTEMETDNSSSNEDEDQAVGEGVENNADLNASNNELLGESEVQDSVPETPAAQGTVSTALTLQESVKVSGGDPVYTGIPPSSLNSGRKEIIKCPRWSELKSSDEESSPPRKQPKQSTAKGRRTSGTRPLDPLIKKRGRHGRKKN